MALSAPTLPVFLYFQQHGDSGVDAGTHGFFLLLSISCRRLLLFVCSSCRVWKVVNAPWLHPQAHKVQISIPGRKKEAVKKPAKKSSTASVPTKNRDNLKKWVLPDFALVYVVADGVTAVLLPQVAACDL